MQKNRASWTSCGARGRRLVRGWLSCGRRNTPSPSHTTFTHYLSQTTLSHTPSLTHLFVTHHLAHTIFVTPLCHTHTQSCAHISLRCISHKTLSHTRNFVINKLCYTHTQLCHTHTPHLSLSHATLFYFLILRHLLCLSFLPRPRYNIWCSLLEEVDLWGSPVI